MAARVTAVLAAGRPHDGRMVDSVILDFERRRAHRGRLVGLKGTELELDLPEPVMLRMGDALVLADGGLVEVVAEAEPLIEARAADLAALARLAWHLGDRHVAVQILPNRIRARRDPAIETLLMDLGARVVAIEAPFDPEGGAYAASGHGHADDHGHHHHAHDHGHHDHQHGHAPERGR